MTETASVTASDPDAVPESDTAPDRRRFLSGTLGGAGAALFASALPGGCSSPPPPGQEAVVKRVVPAGQVTPAAVDTAPVRNRVIVSTWKFGQAANAVAWGRLTGGSDVLDACEAGVRVTEADPAITSVGYGGRPNADGVVQLDSAVMRGDTLECGSVAALENVLHPVSVARAVMERTPHVLLVGDGALEFARGMGVPEQELLTDESRAAWEAWKVKQSEQRAPVEEDHDTLGMIVMDQGRFAMAVTTSGWAYKLPGRVGDSPIIGAGGYCDDDVGAAVATGDGEEMIRTCASFAVVEAMRHGKSPGEACMEVLRRIDKKAGGRKPSVALLAVDTRGRVGARSLRANFDYALSDDKQGTVVIAAEQLA